MTDGQHRPRKRFGQHFLKDGTILNRLVAAIAPAGGRRILEIGPGRGALTDLLVAASAVGAETEKTPPITVVELDRELARRLAQRYPPTRVRVIQADILGFDLSDALAPDEPGGRLRVVGNLPYNISTPLIFHLLNQVERIHDMLFMLQREVALRLCATPGDKNYGRLSVMAAMDLDCEALFDVPPEAFDPPPKVDSTVLRLIPKNPPLTARDRGVFNAIVAAAFGQRRKTLRNALKALAQNEHFVAAKVDPTLRAEALSVEQYIVLADAISPLAEEGGK